MQFRTNCRHRIRVIKETVPIVFVPDAMDSRLKNKETLSYGTRVIRLDLGENYVGHSPAKRKEKLLNDPAINVIHWGDNPKRHAGF